MEAYPLAKAQKSLTIILIIHSEEKLVHLLWLFREKKILSQKGDKIKTLDIGDDNIRC
jgi:hypothetical protein